MFGFGKHIHSWTKWTTDTEVETYEPGASRPTHRYIVQVRHCTECEFKEYNKSKVW